MSAGELVHVGQQRVPTKRGAGLVLAEQTEPLPSKRARSAHEIDEAAAYPFWTSCGPMQCPGWEVALYALVRIGLEPQTAIPANAVSAHLASASFPVAAINLAGRRREKLTLHRSS
ncbi:hypothetical protein AB1Y20_004096 [Prymnesium parvum]|uniref:Cytochrome P450 n=1 Tax=Prymnesium parvum TaxID=97485 RepID=A0AB34J6N1_PRYPA